MEEQKKLEITTQHFQYIFDNLTLIVLALDSEGTIVYANNYLSEVSGWKQEEIIGQNWFVKFIPEKQLNSALSIFNDVINQHEEPAWFSKYENEILTKAQERKLVRWTNISFGNGERTLVALGEDMTESKKTQSQIEKFAKLSSKAQSVGRIGFLNWDLKTNEIELSNEMLDLYGLDKKKRFTTPELIASVVHPDDLEMVQKNLEMAVRGEKKYNLDHRVIHPDGKTMWMHNEAELTKDSFGRPKTLFGTATDISEQKRDRLELEEVANKYSTLFNLARDGIVLVDYDTGNIIDCNLEFESESGFSLEELKKKKIWEIRPTDDIDKTKELFYSFKGEEKIGPVESSFQQPDGSIIPIELVSTIINIRNKKYFYSMTREISKRKDADRKVA